MTQLIELRRPNAPPRDRPIIIVEGRAYRLRECRIDGPPPEVYRKLIDKSPATRYELDMVTTSGERVRGSYRNVFVSIRRSGREVYTFSRSRAQEMLEALTEAD